MIRFRTGFITISLNTRDAGKSVQHTFISEDDDPDDDGIEATKYILYKSGRCYGLHGLPLNEQSSAIDLNHALFHSEITEKWKAQVIEGQKILDAWKPQKAKNKKY